MTGLETEVSQLERGWKQKSSALIYNQGICRGVHALPDELKRAKQKKFFAI